MAFSIKQKTPVKLDFRAETIKEAKRGVLLFGSPGSGKTRTIAELLLRGEQLFMLHCGLGPPGTDALESYLEHRLGVSEAQALITAKFRQFRISSPALLSALTKDKLDFIRRVCNDDKWLSGLTCLIVEEFNGAQGMYERELVPHDGGIPKPSRIRKEKGGDDSYSHYANLKMGTEYIVDQLLSIPYKQVWTAHVSNNAGSEGEVGPWIQTKALLGFAGAFSFCVHLERRRDPFIKPPREPFTYWYDFKGSKYAKARVEGCPYEMKAEPGALWDLIRF